MCCFGGRISAALPPVLRGTVLLPRREGGAQVEAGLQFPAARAGERCGRYTHFPGVLFPSPPKVLKPDL